MVWTRCGCCVTARRHLSCNQLVSYSYGLILAQILLLQMHYGVFKQLRPSPVVKRHVYELLQVLLFSSVLIILVLATRSSKNSYEQQRMRVRKETLTRRGVKNNPDYPFVFKYLMAHYTFQTASLHTYSSLCR